MELGLTPQWGGVGRIPGALLCPGAALLDPSSQRDPSDLEEKDAFKCGLYDQCLVKGRLVLNKMVVAYGVPNMRECFGHSSY